MANASITFKSSDFTSNKPLFSNEGSYSTAFKFATITKTLRLNDTSHGILKFEVLHDNSIDFGSIYFLDPNGGKVSVGTNLNGLFIPSESEKVVQNIFLDSSTSSVTTFYVVVNGDEDVKSEYLDVSISVGTEGTPPSTSTVQLLYDCQDQIQLYEYTTGLHAYSPYDAKAGSSTLTTKLYSRVAIDSWTTNTRVW
jgi:hypothetical protein